MVSLDWLLCRRWLLWGLFMVASVEAVLLFCFEFALICACGLILRLRLLCFLVGLVMVYC